MHSAGMHSAGHCIVVCCTASSELCSGLSRPSTVGDMPRRAQKAKSQILPDQPTPPSFPAPRNPAHLPVETTTVNQCVRPLLDMVAALADSGR